jgi:glyoxylase-like metal-dependent hydrolase (beta-lactamase superfamily II)
MPNRRPASAGYGPFPGGVGNTQQDPARFNSLYAGVVDKIFERLPDTTWVYPGHGGDTTLGAERPYLEEWRARLVKRSPRSRRYGRHQAQRANPGPELGRELADGTPLSSVAECLAARRLSLPSRISRDPGTTRPNNEGHTQ